MEKELTVPEVAQLLGRAEYTVRKMIREGRIQAHVNPGSAGYRVFESDLLKIKPSKKVTPVSIETLPEQSGPVLLVTMLEKIQAEKPESYQKILKQIYLEYCKML